VARSISSLHRFYACLTLTLLNFCYEHSRDVSNNTLVSGTLPNPDGRKRSMYEFLNFFFSLGVIIIIFHSYIICINLICSSVNFCRNYIGTSIDANGTIDRYL
jgi:hypothetical protein